MQEIQLHEVITPFVALITALAIAYWKRKRDFNDYFINTKDVISLSVKDKQLNCFFCQGDKFLRLEGVINTTILLLFRFGFLNKSAVCYKCENCGYVHWFVNPSEKK